MKTILVGRDKELRFLASSLSTKGHLRAGLVKGVHGMGKTDLLEAVEQKLLEREKHHLFLSPKANDFSDPLTFCTALVRSARSGPGISQAALNNFARTWGSRVMKLAKDTVDSSDKSTNGSTLAEAWVKLLEESLDEQGVEHQSITPVLILDDLDLYGNETIDWLTGPFNQTIRKSGLFKRTRFLFSSKEHNSKLQGIFDRFGFEKVQHFYCPHLARLNARNLRNYGALDQWEVGSCEK